MNRRKAWIVRLAVSLLTYSALVILPPERANYRKLVSIANRTSGSPDELEGKARAVHEQSKDDDIRFVADYLATTYSTMSNYGLRDLSQTVSGGGWNVFVTSGLNSILRPGHSFTAMGQTVWLYANESSFKQVASSLDNRYSGLHKESAILSGIAGILSVPLLKISRRKRGLDV